MLWVLGLAAICFLAAYYFFQVPDVIDQRHSVYMALVNYAKLHPEHRSWVFAIFDRYPMKDNTFFNYINPFNVSHWKNQRDVLVPNDKVGALFKEGFIMSTD